jgi:putative cell wall-binding protein
VLLVAANSLPAETAAALRTLQPRNIAVLGGTNAVSNPVLEQLRGYTAGGVTRLAGADRYATAVRLSQTFWTGTAPVVYLATGRNFPDALAGVPAAGRDEAPLLLVEPTCVPVATARELARLQPTTTVVLGGASSVSAAAAAGTVCAPPAPAPAPAPAPTPAPAPVPAPAPAPAPPTGVYYANCAEARAAGAAPIRRGQPGYRAGLDRDNDGIACE